MAHPPIHPTKYANNLNGNEQRIYEYIVRHFLACVSKDALGHETVVHVDIADEKFTAKGLFILERNYLDVYTYEKWNAKEIHEYRVGDTFMPSVLELVESNTTPPKLLTEADLITLMEKYGIGTDATHAEHIETIKSREYVGLHENIYFVPGTLGMGLVEGYNNIGLEVSLAKPNLRAEFEKDLKLICEGLKNPETVRREQIENYRTVFRIVMERMLEIDRSLANRLEDQPQQIQEDVHNREEFKSVLKCPKCNNDLIIRNRKNGTGKYLGCTGYPQCKNAIWFPISMETIEVLEEHCPICGPDVKKLKVKFRHNPFPGEPNPNIICIGGCDNLILDTLDIKLASVKRANTAVSYVTVPNAPPNNTRQPNVGTIPNQRTLNNWITGTNDDVPVRTPLSQNINDTHSNRTTAPSQTSSNNNRQRGGGTATSTNRSRSFLSGGVTSNTGHVLPIQQNNSGHSSNNNVCNCNVEAILLTVKKEGPNKGRQFYKCQNSTCNYFMWATENVPGANLNTTLPNLNTTLPTSSNVLKCECNLNAIERMVSKEGQNNGRKFFCCPKPIGEGCRFFKWTDEINANGTHNNGNDDDDNDNSRRGPGSSWNGNAASGNSGNTWKKKNTKWKSKKNTKSTGTLKPYLKNSSQTRKTKLCGLCRQEGHTRTKCPNK